VRFINEHKGVFGIEPVCRVLSGHGCPIAPSTYYDADRRPPSARAVRDEQLKAAITRIHADNFGVYGRGRCGWRSTVRASRWRGAPWSG
jgi:putative transposase